MNDFVVFDGRLYVKQRYISDQGWMKDSGLSKALKRNGIERLAPSDLGLSGAGGAGAGKFLLATDAIVAIPPDKREEYRNVIAAGVYTMRSQPASSTYVNVPSYQGM